MNIPATHLILLALCLGIAAVWDVARRRIPNPLTASVATLGVGVQLWDRGAPAALSAVAVGVLCLLVLYRAWLAGGIGGGDVKLAAAVAIWIGLSRQLIVFALGTAVAGGIVAAVCYGLSGRAVRREIQANLIGAAALGALPTVARDGDKARVSVPYGIAVAAGAAVALCGRWGI